MDNYLQELLFTLIALVIVIAMAWLLLKAFKEFHSKQGKGNPIKLILTMPVGSRERLMVVTYREHEYFVGITPNGMTLLDKLPAAEDDFQSQDGPSSS